MEPKIGYVDPEYIERLQHIDAKKARTSYKRALKKLDEAIVKQPSLELPKAKTTYTDKELLDFMETQLVRGMAWYPLHLDRDHVYIAVCRVGYALGVAPTFRDAIADALDASTGTFKQDLKTHTKVVKSKYAI